MTKDIYGKNLKNVVEALSKAGISAEVRGSDTSRFVFSKLNDRATEISWAGDEGIFVEYWQGPEESESCFEGTVASFELAVRRAISWFNQES